mgnify:CR=1 FL=1
MGGGGVGHGPGKGQGDWLSQSGGTAKAGLLERQEVVGERGVRVAAGHFEEGEGGKG